MKAKLSQLVSYGLSLVLSTVVALQVEPRLLIFLPALILALRWYWIGLVGLVGAVAYIIVAEVGGAGAFLVIMTFLLTLELASMVHRAAPLRHHAYLWTGIPASFGLYIMLRGMRSSLPRPRITVVAVLLMVAMYLFVRDVIR